MASRTTTTPSLLRKTLKRHGLSMRKNALQVALQCVVSVTTAGYYSEEDTCDKLLEVFTKKKKKKKKIKWFLTFFFFLFFSFSDFFQIPFFFFSFFACCLLLKFIEDEGVTSCVVDEKTVNAAAKKLIEQTKVSTYNCLSKDIYSLTFKPVLFRISCSSWVFCFCFQNLDATFFFFCLYSDFCFSWTGG